MKTRIVFVDESQETLESYRQALAVRAQVWAIETYTEPEAALDAISRSAPDVVIAGVSLAGSDGAEFLAEIEKRQPDTQRFIAASEAERASIEASLGSCYHYLPKPCPADRLITEIQRCLAIDTWLGNQRIKEIVAKMGAFPSLPPIYLKVVNALNSRSASTDEIGHAVAGDIAISAKLLQVVNSSYYGFDEKISDIAQAVGILGLEAVKNLVLAIQVFGKLGRSDDQKALIDQLWHHSMSVAVAAKRISKHETGSEKAAEEAYTAGLLHDIGKLVLISAVPDEFAKARELARERKIPLWKAENEVIGCNHAETGAYVLGRWGMPATLVEAVALHHEPVNSAGTQFSALSAVHAANALVWERHPGEEQSPEATPDEGFLSEIGRADSWNTWREVVTGKRTENAAGENRLSLKKTSSPSDERPAPSSPSAAETRSAAAAAPTVLPSPDRPSEHDANDAEPAPSSGNRAALIGIALAACLGVAAGVFLLTRSNSAKASLSDTEADSQRHHHNSLKEDLEQTAQDLATARWDDDLKKEFLGDEAKTAPAETPTPAEAPPSAPSATVADAPAQPVAEPEPAVAETPAAPQPLPHPTLAKPQDSFPDIALAGIFFNESNPLASINGKIRRVGDTVSGARIVSIDRKNVVVSYNDEVRTFRLK